MKKITFTFALIAAAMLISGCTNTQKNAENASEQTDATAVEETAAKVSAPAGSIVYFNLDRVLEEYDMATDLRNEVETKVNAIQKDVDRRQRNLENAAKDFENKYNKGLMTSATIAKEQQKLQQQQLNFQQFAQQKQQEIMEEQQVMMNKLADAIKTYVENYNVEKQYALILSNQASVPVITGDPTLDITDEIVAGLNAEYVNTKNSNAE